MTLSDRVNENVGRRNDGDKATLFCTHCGQELVGDADDYISKLPRHEGPLTEAGPQVFADSAVFVDAPVVFRQYYCPKCYTVFLTEIVPQ